MNDAPDFASRFVLGMAQTALSGGLLAGIAWAANKWLPRLSHAWRGILWWVVCARFVLGFACAGFVPPSSALVVVVPPFWEVHSPNVNTASPQVTDGSQFPLPATNANPQTEPPSASQNEPAAKVNAFPLFTLPLSLLVVWLGGFLVRAAISATQYARLQKRVRWARLVTGEATDAPARALLQAANDAAHQMNRPTVARLLLSPSPCDPLVTGWRKPAVLLSQSDAARLSPQELTLVLLHEMAHLQRRDLLWGMVPHFALHLFWFWPPVYFACREWSLACEAACDGEAARAAQTSPHVYGELLLKLGTAQTTSPFFAALPVSVSFRLLQRRLLMLNSSFSTAPASPRRRILTAFSTAALLSFALPLALLPVRFDAHASDTDGATYTKTNHDTGKPWAAYPDAAHHINFGDGLARWEQGKDDKAHGYLIGVAKPKAPTDGPSVFLQAVSPTKGEYGVLMQHVRPGPFRGKRVRFSGWVKTFWARTAVHGAGFWLRMDTPTWQRAWNKLSAPLTGTPDWTKLSYVFDVPGDAQGFSFGINLAGSGTANLHDPTFEVVDKSVPVSVPAFDSSPEAAATNAAPPKDRSFALDFDNPTNLDFKNGLVGWWNDNPDHTADRSYAIRDDKGAGRNTGPSNPNRNAALLESTVAHPQSYGTLAQNTQAKNLLGKRVRFSVFLKTENAQAAGFWIVVHAGENSTGYNRLNNPITGTTPWKKYETEIDIPRDATGISYGLDLSGTGKIWTDEIDLVAVGDAKPVASSGRNKWSGVNWGAAQTHPSNLDFAAGLTGWQKTAPHSDALDYEAGVDTNTLRPGGKAAPAFLRAIQASPKGYAALMQGTQAGDFKNHRVRFSGFIKTEAARDARLFLRLDTKHGVFARNMDKHPVEGTTGWTRFEYVLDVPADAEGMAYGLSLHGPGQAWADGFRFEIVSADVPVTRDPARAGK